MKKLLTLTTLLLLNALNAQEHPCAVQKRFSAAAQIQTRKAQAAAGPYTSHDQKYDTKFVHLDLEVQSTSKYLKGSAKSIATVTVAALDTFMVLLHQDLQVDSVQINGLTLLFTRQDSMVKVKTQNPLPFGSTFTSQVWYEGLPPQGGAAIGSGFSSGKDWNYGLDVTWSLSQPFVAYHWWPCKQELTDKIDSSWVFVTTDAINMAGSNGLLEQVVDLGPKKRYEWKSRSPIDYYLISVAVSQYTAYNLYAKPQYLPNDSILVQNFVFAKAPGTSFFENTEKPQINRIPELIGFFSDMYGMYPFYKEKYGHCIVPIGGGMEHQTMTSQGFMHLLWLNVHELAHQWFGNSITCKSWSDIWINEGFASYSEHLVHEYLEPQAFENHLNSAHGSVMAHPGGSCHFSGADTLNTSRIFDSRLTYDKGGAIIHTLRFVTSNDSLWFGTLKDFQYSYKHSTASVQDFVNFYHSNTGIDPTQFFTQWYYGEGYPMFSLSWNQVSGKVLLQNTQTTSQPAVTPLFITPVEYTFVRVGLPDTVIRLMHDETVENYTLNIPGEVKTVLIDKKNWLINRTLKNAKDLGASVPENTPAVVRVKPNPGHGIFYLEGVPAGGSVMVHDVHGRIVLKQPGGENMHIDLSAQASGIYILSVYDSKQVLRGQKKIVKTGG